MTTIRQLIQTSPTKADELLAKLADTSENAVKTRDRLFSELKEELELLAEIEEKHLFPVLRKHKQTRDLVAEAINDNRQTRKLLAELEKAPKDSEDFGTKVADLRRVFQQHVRNEKKELLPAVLKALDEEEAQGIVDRIQNHKAEVDQQKRSDAEERRAAVRQERERGENLHRAAEAVARTMWSGPQEAERMARTAREALQGGAGALSEAAQRSQQELGQVAAVMSERARDLVARSSQDVQAITRSNAVLARGLQEISSAWLNLAQARLQRNLERLNEFSRCQSLLDVVGVQSSLVRENFELMLGNSREIAQLSSKVAEEATRAIVSGPGGGPRQTSEGAQSRS